MIPIVPITFTQSTPLHLSHEICLPTGPVQLHRSAEKPMNTKWTAIVPWPCTPLGTWMDHFDDFKTFLILVGVMKIKTTP